jgi:hypothetical protein
MLPCSDGGNFFFPTLLCSGRIGKHSRFLKICLEDVVEIKQSRDLKERVELAANAILEANGSVGH